MELCFHYHHTPEWRCAQAYRYHYILLLHFSKVKGKVHPTIYHEGPEGEQRYSSTLSLTLVLHGTPCPGRFTPGKDARYRSYRRLCRPQRQSGRVRKISPKPGFDPRNAAEMQNYKRVSLFSTVPVATRSANADTRFQQHM